MSHPAEHPDDLLVRARRGDLSPLERERLDAHLHHCAACAFERSLANDLRAEAAATGDAWLDRIVTNVTEQHLSARPPRHALTRRPTAWLIAAAVALVAVTAFAAAVVIPRLGHRPEAPVTHVPRVTAPTTTGHAIVPHEAPVVPLPPPVTETPALVEPPRVVHEASPSAAELYRRANDARHARDDRAAMRLYGDLIGHHPASREALQARVSLGRLLLDRHEDPARAARLFQDYLHRAAGAPDEEAALVGLARAYQSLGRRSEERAAWERLLARHPGSLHAETARARIDALR
jgi:TolA-binding protein